MKFKNKILINGILWIIIIQISIHVNAQENAINIGATEESPSRSEYFSWINNTNEGATEHQSLINLNFFTWMKEEYGMQLDIYAFDAGAIDGKRFYGSTNSNRFKRQFPNGFDPIYEAATEINTRLGIWGGPDGFGDTPQSEKERTQQMLNLCKNYNFALFKFDAVCGQLRPEKETAFINMMQKCREYSPDLILLNHRLGLEDAQQYATTFLWEGRETYIDVFSVNEFTAPHHRAGALKRGLVPDLKRLTEDHGVCLSSCLDYWDDELILQTFNRNLILSPQIYGNPWFLRDNEFPKLARIFNLHQMYKKILVNGMQLPESYGPAAVSRGNENTRIITLRNLSWEDTIYYIKLGKEIGLAKGGNIKLKQVHPTELFLGEFSSDDSLGVRVSPFRSCMLIASNQEFNEFELQGSEYQIIKDVPDQDLLVEILGLAGIEKEIKLSHPELYSNVILDQKENTELLNGNSIMIKFPGEKIDFNYHRFLGEINEVRIPDFAEALYEATAFSADNNALEVRSIERSGWSKIEEVRAAQEAFFQQDVFVNRGIHDDNLFDSDLNTGFWPSKKYDIDQSVHGGCFRLDMGSMKEVDSLKIIIPDYFSLHPLLKHEAYYAEISSDLRNWKELKFLADTTMIIAIHDSFRYFRMNYFPQRISEVFVYHNNEIIQSEEFSASNLFAPSHKMNAVKAWSAEITLNHIPENAYLCIAIEGKHGVEGAYAACKIDQQFFGCPDRAPSYPSNTWEYVNAHKDSYYTYYFPLDPEMKNKEIEVFVLAYNKEHLNFTPKIYLNTYPMPYEKISMRIKRKN